MEYVGVNWTQEEVGMEGKRSELAVVKQKVRLQEWSAQVEAQQASGLTVPQWCAENGIKTKSFYYRMRRVPTKQQAHRSEPESIIYSGIAAFVTYVPDTFLRSPESNPKYQLFKSSNGRF